MKIPIIHEDNHLLVVVKPPGIPSQADQSGDPDMLTLLKEDLKKRHNKPGKVYLGLVQRLDRPTGGVMIFAKTSKAASRLSDQIRRQVLKKEYVAILEGTPPPDGMLTDHLLKDRDSNTVRPVPPDTEGAKEASLSYRALSASGGQTLVLVHLHTGRSHQIRVQFASRGAPLLGDRRYGNNPADSELALWAYRLRLEHPTTGELLNLESCPPDATHWEPFKDILCKELPDQTE